MKKLCLVIWFFSVASSVFGQETGILTGVVTDSETDETLIGANVVMVSDKSK